MKPEISIVMSTYNESTQDLTKAIDSMLNQTFKNFEFIIIYLNFKSGSPWHENGIEILHNYKLNLRRYGNYI